MLTVVIPAHNEETVLASCLESIVSSSSVKVPIEIIVVPNGCTDGTAEVAQSFVSKFAARGWRMQIIELEKGNKVLAMDAGDKAACFQSRAYIDADVTLSPDLISQLCDTLNVPSARFVSGTLRITANSWVGRAYAAAYSRIPFMKEGVPGCGLFAVNSAGRVRWGTFPDTISDDLYVRLLFEPIERHAVPATYDWPVPDSFRSLVRVRARQARGVQHLGRLFPNLKIDEESSNVSLRSIFMMIVSTPFGFLLYTAVAIIVRLGRQQHRLRSKSLEAPDWVRGR